MTAGELCLKLDELVHMYEDDVLSEAFEVCVTNGEMLEVVRDFLAALKNSHPDAKVGQIKEKFGHLRIYMNPVIGDDSDEVHHLAFKYERKYNETREQ